MVGATGAGKSTLMRQFIKEGCSKPLQSAPHSEDSTSADIHAYIGTFPNKKSPTTTLMLDCEGMNGGFPKALFNPFKKLMHTVGALLEMRKPYVNTAYPRLLYMFSTVFVFVFTGSFKEKQTWVKTIEKYASLAASATINQLSLPSLVVIFNKCSYSEGIWDTEEASARAKNILEFKNLFSEVKIVCIHFTATYTY